ncbi:serine/threonine-protein kinase [Chitinispirillales bacterium ANBcel5]|uniref:serine/threonine-protein kinase n=1 Tax=Cellulosispirillum alkaliphilum TaxID=3039283 RepID=UPI002A570FE0|nr:serine/threonine-protein kinase [Chitinispirillales bacterium ANBcel5]
MFLKSIKESYQPIDYLVSKIGDAIPFKFRMEFEILPSDRRPLKKQQKILRKVFKHHKPPIVIEEHIGTGGFADVYSATSEYNGVKDFAIKILREDLLRIRKGKQFKYDQEQMRVKEVKQRFKNESYVQWDLSKSVSENVANSVVPVYDHGEFDSNNQFRFILMERMGMTLRDYINESKEQHYGKSPLCRCRIMSKIAEKISNVHTEGIFHRDIKPENILFPRTKSPKELCNHCSGENQCDIDVRIGDFGTVRWIKSYTDKYDAVIIGSQFYLSPEQFFNPKTIDKRTDIYSFGVICYELLYGSHPKDISDTTSNLLEKLACQEITPRTPPTGFEQLHQIILKCMNDRWSRYQTMEEALNDLNKFISDKDKEKVTTT